MFLFQFTGDLIKLFFFIVRQIWDWYKLTRPARKVLGAGASNKSQLEIFVKDFIVPNNTMIDPKLFSEEGGVRQINPNILKVWADVESKGVMELSNLLGRLGKKDKLVVVEMSSGFGNWSSNMIVLGAQSMKSINFYSLMENVAYKMDDRDIYDNRTNKVIPRDSEYGYGLILKSKNPNTSKNQLAILLGGFGTLGTEAAIHYFCKNIGLLGKEFGSKHFGIIVRAKISAGKESAQRIKKYDKVFK